MNATLKLIHTSAKLQMRYTTAMLAGMATNIAWGVFRYFLVGAFYIQQNFINGFSRESAATYVPLTQSLMVLLNIFGSMEISQAVHRGDISSVLMRPMGFIRYWLAYYGGKSIINLLLRSFFSLFIFMLIFPIQFPDSLISFLLFLVSLLYAWFISHLWIILINLTAFWLVDATGVLRMAFSIQQLLAGMLFPLRLLPSWFSRMAYFTPFPSMLNIPIEIFTNTVDFQQTVWLLIQQLSWLILLMITTQIVYHAGVRRLVISGG